MTRSRRGFTLVELLTSIGIIAIITGITVIAFAVVAKDARVSLAKNTVTAALDNGRNLAIKNREIVMVIFRQRKRATEQYVEVLMTRWSRDTYTNWTYFYDVQYDRFIPIPDAPVRELPPGIGIACPDYGTGSDFQWVTQGDLLKGEALDTFPSSWTEATGAIIGVMYGVDGSVLSRNSFTDTNFAFVDFNSDGYQQWRDMQSLEIVNYTNGEPAPPPPSDPVDTGGPEWEPTLGWMQSLEEDERFVEIAPFIAVYDRDEAYEQKGFVVPDANWSSPGHYQVELLDSDGFINTHAERIHFNRFTGVVMQ